MQTKPFQRNPRIDEAVTKVLEYIAGCDRGEFIPWLVIEQLSGFGRKHRHFSAFYWRTRKTLLRDYGRTWTCVREQGITIDPTTAQLRDWQKTRLRKSQSQMRKNRRELECLPGEELTDHQKFERSARLDIIETVTHATKVKAAVGDYLSKPTPTSQPRVK